MRNEKVFKYTAVFEASEDGGYAVSIPALPGCISEGETFEDALKNIKEAATLYLDDLRASNEKIPSEQEPVVVSPIEIEA